MLEIQITANNDITIGEKLISLGGVMRVYSMFQNFHNTYSTWTSFWSKIHYYKQKKYG